MLYTGNPSEWGAEWSFTIPFISWDLSFLISNINSWVCSHCNILLANKTFQTSKRAVFTILILFPIVHIFKNCCFYSHTSSASPLPKSIQEKEESHYLEMTKLSITLKCFLRQGDLYLTPAGVRSLYVSSGEWVKLALMQMSNKHASNSYLLSRL